MGFGQVKQKGVGRKSLRFSDTRGDLRTGLRNRRGLRVMGGQAERNVGFRLAQFGVCSWGQD